MGMSEKIPASEITPRSVYFNRRTFMRGGIVAASAAGTALLYRKFNGIDLSVDARPELKGLVQAPHTDGYWTDEEMTPLASVTNYNNFYEFTTNKDGVAAAAKDFKTDGWRIEVGGLCHKPHTFDLDDLHKIAPPEERVYRHRCVEAWSMVVPWAGIPLAKLLAKVEPTSDAKFVAFETLLDPKRMPGQNGDALIWPYVEGLRIDEAMHPLALLATGLYGMELPPQDGAPVKLVLPWKYGFKGIKSIVKITFVAAKPITSWNRYAPKEYGFYGNVNPHHDHPRWTQASERRIGESGRRPTLMFNGYAEQVGMLYAGMDLDVDY
jgi:methionine sulfoxide reductase catalytic subunit